MVSKPLLIAGFVLGLVGLTSPAVAQSVDCNGNGIDDACDLDCGVTGGPCDVPGCGGSVDCNGNSVPDECDVSQFFQDAKLTATDAAAGDEFGVSVSISGDTAILGARFDDDACPADPNCDSGSAYVFVRTGAVWTQQAKLTAADAAAGDRFGISVSINDDTVVIGSVWDDDAGDKSGSAYVFVRNAGVWTQQAKLTAADGGFGNQFGTSVSISGDTVLVGTNMDIKSSSRIGSVYVFVRSGTVWTQQAKLTAADGAPVDLFGVSVSVNGETAVIGSVWDDDAGNNSGSAYVFVRSGTVWDQQAKLTAADAAADDWFGSSASISGGTAVIGSWFDDDAGSSSGSAYVFVRSGNVWIQQAKLTATDAAAGDLFSRSVSISGETMVIGSYFDDDAGIDSGSAYIFIRTAGVWTQHVKLTAADAAAGDEYGISASINGNIVIIGARRDDDTGTNSGSAYLYSTNNSDCQVNGIPDECDIVDGTSLDCNANGIPDACEVTSGNHLDCQANGIPDTCDIAVGTSFDNLPIGGDGIPDECQSDCNGNLVPDTEDINTGTSQDCNSNSIPDECDITNGTSLDCNANGMPDVCDLASGNSQDCQANGIPDQCDIAVGISIDNLPIGGDGIPDECQFDCNGNLIPDANDLADGTSQDCQRNGIPDECEITDGSSHDCNANGNPDECDVSFIQQAKLNATDAATADFFGNFISISGDTAVIGSRSDDDACPADVFCNSGSAYVFIRNGDLWSQQAKLTAADAAADDEFGISVSISGDSAIIGAWHDDDTGSDSGSAYVFVRTGTIWTQQAKLTATDGAPTDLFGSSVSISGDTVVIGSSGDNDGGISSGSVYVFVRTAGVWTQQAKLTAADAAAFDEFGISVSIDGDTVVIGSTGDDEKGISSGSVYVFVRTAGVWIQQAKLTAIDGAAFDFFGNSVSISGNTVVIGAYLDDDAGSGSGSAYVFVRSGVAWTEQFKLTAADAATFDEFGISVSIDGDTAIIGAPLDDDANSSSGSAYVFVRSAGVWIQREKLTAADATLNDMFGSSVSIRSNITVVGAIVGDAAVSDSGSAYVFSMISFDVNGNGNPDECDTVGDFDGDGVFSTDDLMGFVDNLLNPGGTILGDFDGNGLADGQDIPLAVACLVDGICP